jgi:acyl-CoA reductase-like NAD-dependent aldehyde dehydrogenase
LVMIEVVSPTDGHTVGKVEELSAFDVAELADRLRSAQPAWEDLGAAGRATIMLRWADWILDHQRSLGELIQEESGKAWADASLETTMAVEFINYYAKHASEFLAERRIRPHSVISATKRLTVSYRPYPLVGIITPWNGPLAGPSLDVMAALMAGAAVLTKPSEVAPLSWTEAVRGFLEDVGGPGILAAANGRSDTGRAVVDVVDMVMFTGSTATGRTIGARCGERLVPCSLELGGKDAMIVLADADIDRAAAAATWGAMMNSGQTCVSVERVYAEEAVYDEFVANVTQRIAALRQGTDAPGTFTQDVGAMATQIQLEIVEAQVRGAEAAGARVMAGGHRASQGLFFEPTVLVDVDHSMACMREETFGPILPIVRVADADEAVRLANDSPYGLSASVWSENEDRARQIARQLETGAVNINNVMINLFQFGLPQGGWKQSGVGSRLGGAHGMLKYCRAQSITADRMALKREPYWYPVTPRRGAIIAAGARLMAAHDWKRRLGWSRRSHSSGD